VRRALIRKTPYVMIYALLKDELVVIAIAHSRQEPGYWRKRIGDAGP
jgi:hypothetical protein